MPFRRWFPVAGAVVFTVPIAHAAALRYMHTPVETLRMSDVTNTIRLLVAFSEAVREDTSFMP